MEISSQRNIAQIFLTNYRYVCIIYCAAFFGHTTIKQLTIETQFIRQVGHFVYNGDFK